jgi:RimJ/RimL family protein N-acetyltransferase
MSKIIFLRGAKTILRPVDKSYAPLFQKWVNDPDVRKFVLNTLPADLQREEEWVDSISKNQNQVVVIIEDFEGKPIGTMGLHNIRWVDGVATTGALIGEKDYWNQGYGTDAKMILLHYAFGNLGLRKICSSVKAFNKRSKAYQEKTGYQVEGIRRKQILYNGRYYDEILMAIFKAEFMKKWRVYRKEHSL